MIDVVMPQMGESIVEGTLTRWLKKPGEQVERDEPLFEISTDKVDTEIPSPVAGTLGEVLVQEGTTVAINSVVARIQDGASGANSRSGRTCCCGFRTREAPAGGCRSLCGRLQRTTRGSAASASAHRFRPLLQRPRRLPRLCPQARIPSNRPHCQRPPLLPLRNANPTAMKTRALSRPWCARWPVSTTSIWPRSTARAQADVSPSRTWRRICPRKPRRHTVRPVEAPCSSHARQRLSCSGRRPRACRWRNPPG